MRCRNTANCWQMARAALVARRKLEAAEGDAGFYKARASLGDKVWCERGFEAVVDGVWVTSPRAALPVATVLRNTLLQVNMARQASEGQQTKTEMIYQYLTGPRFRHRVEAIVEAFSTMQEDLDKERKAIMKQWAKREEQIERVMGATVGMYGDLQGIAGKSLQEIESLELIALENKSNSI